MQHQRKDRVGDLVKREIAHLIQYELKDPGIGFLTIIDVSMSVDLRYARIFYTVLGDEDCRNKTASALKRARGFIQREVGKRLKLRYTPEISFDFDTSVEHGAHIEELIQKIHQEENPAHSEPGMDEDLPEKPYSDEDEKDD
jgi:ribosome-binding factor A